jgi:hypothetical protein
MSKWFACLIQKLWYIVRGWTCGFFILAEHQHKYMCGRNNRINVQPYTGISECNRNGFTQNRLKGRLTRELEDHVRLSLPIGQTRSIYFDIKYLDNTLKEFSYKISWQHFERIFIAKSKTIYFISKQILTTCICLINHQLGGLRLEISISSLIFFIFL